MATKNYIGKGKAGKFNSVRVTLQMRLAEEFIYENNGEKYITFYVAPLQHPDDYGKTHTAYVVAREEAEAHMDVLDQQEMQAQEPPLVEPVATPAKRKRKK